MATNAISILQDHCVHNSLPIPSYHFEELTKPPLPAKFACHCTMGHIAAVSSASSKKEAKHNVAKIILQKIGVPGPEQKAATVQQEKATVPLRKIIMENQVGMLNEYCSKNRYKQPAYFEIGMRNGQFVVQCKHQSFVTEGMGGSKKLAKHIAAYNMLVMLNKAPVQESRPAAPSTPGVCTNIPDVVIRPEKEYDDQEILDLYDEIMHNKHSTESQTVPTFKLIDPFKPSNYMDDYPHEDVAVARDERTEETSEFNSAELEKQIDAFTPEYTTQLASKNPNIVCLHLADATYIEVGESVDECIIKLFLTAFDNYKN